MVWTSGWLCETGSLRSCFCVFHFTKVRRATRGTQGKVDKDDSSALYAARKLTSRRRQRGNNTRLLLFPRRVSRSDPICVCGQDSNLQKKPFLYRYNNALRWKMNSVEIILQQTILQKSNERRSLEKKCSFLFYYFSLVLLKKKWFFLVELVE